MEQEGLNHLRTIAIEFASQPAGDRPEIPWLDSAATGPRYTLFGKLACQLIFVWRRLGPELPQADLMTSRVQVASQINEALLCSPRMDFCNNQSDAHGTYRAGMKWSRKWID
jgi:hypothetical protein